MPRPVLQVIASTSLQPMDLTTLRGIEELGIRAFRLHITNKEDATKTTQYPKWMWRAIDRSAVVRARGRERRLDMVAVPTPARQGSSTRRWLRQVAPTPVANLSQRPARMTVATSLSSQGPMAVAALGWVQAQQGSPPVVHESLQIPMSEGGKSNSG